MTPIAIMLLLSAGILGSLFDSGPDDVKEHGDDRSDDPDLTDGQFAHGDLVSHAIAPPHDTDPATDTATDLGSDLDPGPNPDDTSPSTQAPAEAPADTAPQAHEIHGTQGDDLIEISATENDAGNTFFGGDGRDFIRTSSLAPYDGQSATDRFSTHLGSGDNTVYGGAGDDIIEVSRNDVAEGGSGRDTFLVISDVSPAAQARDPVEVRDLNPGEDTLIVNVAPDLSGNHADGAAPPLHTLVTKVTDGEDTLIVVNGTPTVRILGKTDINIGVQDDPDAPFSVSDLSAITDAGYLNLAGLGGHALSGALPDVIVRYYAETR